MISPEWTEGGGGKIRILNCGKTLIPPVLKLSFLSEKLLAGRLPIENEPALIAKEIGL